MDLPVSMHASEEECHGLRQRCLFLQSRLKEKDDVIYRTRAESCMNAQALKRFVDENKKLAKECEKLLSQCRRLESECSLYEHDREVLEDFANEADERAKEAEIRVQDLEEELRSVCARQTADDNLRNLEDFANQLAPKLIELDKQSLTFSDKVVQLNSLYDSWFKMVQEEKDLASQCARKQYDQLHTMTSHVISENNELLLVQKGQEFAMVQHAEECRLAEERIQILESEAESNLSRKAELELLVSKLEEMVQHAEECRLAEERIQILESEAESNLSRKAELELLVSKLEEKINALSENARLSDTKMQDLILKFTALESESKYSTEKLQGDIDRHKQHLDALEKEVDKLQTTIEEKEQLDLRSKDREELEDENAELQVALVDAEQEEECRVANLKLTAEKLVKEQASENAKFRVPRLTRHQSAEKSVFEKLVGPGSPFRPGYKSPGRKGFLHRFGFG